MGLSRVLVQELGNGRLSPEFASVERGALNRELPCRRFLAKKLLRGQVPLDRDTLVAADIPSMHAAMRQLGIEPPAPDDYPEALGPWLRRRVWRSTLGDALPGDEPDPAVVMNAVRALGEDREAYAIDFGVLADGATALVERNDGYGIGSYGLDDDVYFDLLATRWAELLA